MEKRQAGWRRLWPPVRLHRIVDRPEGHDAPGAWSWDEKARRRRDAAARHAAGRFLDGGHEGDDCWRCEAAVAVGALGLCRPCLDELQDG